MMLPLREGLRYKAMNDHINEAICAYYETCCDYKKCENICITTFRLLKYLRTEIRGLAKTVEKNRIVELNDAIMGYYSVGDSSSIQDEIDAIEILSRSAYKEFKTK